MKRLAIQLLCLAAALPGGGCRDERPGAGPPLLLLCGAGLKPALDELLPAFATATGIVAEPDYAGSGILLTRARQEGVADLFLPGDGFYVDELQRLSGRVAERTEIATLRPCLIVARGNPRGIRALQDLTRPEVRLAVGNAQACQIGRLTAEVLARAGIDPAGLGAKESLTVSELGLWVTLHDVDAAVVWDATALALGPAVEVVPLPLDPAAISRVTLALLTDARHPAAAREFMRFCRGARAQAILRRLGYGVAATAAGSQGAAPGERP